MATRDVKQSSMRRRVADLPSADVQYIFAQAASIVYITVVPLLALPFVTSGFEISGIATTLSVAFSLIIFFLPVVAYGSAITVLNLARRTIEQSSQVDDDTHRLVAQTDVLQYRQDLQQKYARNLNDASPVRDLLVDALRRALTDRWEPPRRLVEGYASRIGGRLGAVASLQRTALQLGILGTFIGLMIAFQTEAFDKSVRPGSFDPTPLTDALKLAFGTSIAGLIASVYIIGIHTVARTSARLALNRMELMVDNVFDLAKQLRQDPSFISDLSQVREHVIAMSKSVDGVAIGYRDVIAAVVDGGRQLREGRDEFDARVAKMIKEQAKLLSQMESIYGKIEPARLAAKLQSALTNGGAAVAEQIKQSAQATSDLHKLLGELTAHEKEHATLLQELRKEGQALQKQLDRIADHVASPSRSDRSSSSTRGWFRSLLIRS